MKPQEKRNIIILIVISIIIVSVLLFLRGRKEKENANDSAVGGTSDETVIQLESGTKLNTSEKLAEKKYFDNYEVSNIQLIEKDGKTTLRADVKNIGETKAEITTLEVKFYDKKGNEMTTIKDALIADIEPGQKTKLNVSTTSELVDAYDFSIKKAK